MCFTIGIPESVQEGCFLCGSTGQDKMFYCKVCAEPFHGYCLDEEPVDESTWCCDNCSTCVVCGLQDKVHENPFPSLSIPFPSFPFHSLTSFSFPFLSFPSCVLQMQFLFCCCANCI